LHSPKNSEAGDKATAQSEARRSAPFAPGWRNPTESGCLAPAVDSLANGNRNGLFASKFVAFLKFVSNLRAADGLTRAKNSVCGSS